MGHHEVAAGSRGQRREPVKIVRREQVGVVDQEHVVHAQFREVGRLPVDGGTGRREGRGERVQQHGLAVPARTDHVDPARRCRTRGGLVHESTRRG